MPPHEGRRTVPPWVFSVPKSPGEFVVSLLALGDFRPTGAIWQVGHLIRPDHEASASSSVRGRVDGDEPLGSLSAVFYHRNGEKSGRGDRPYGGREVIACYLNFLSKSRADS